MLPCSRMALCSMDFWVKLAQIVQGFFTPIIVLFLGIITYQIQRQQARTQRHEAETHRLQYRFGLMDRRMRVFDAIMKFIGLVLRDAHIQSLEPLAVLITQTREHHLLFGAEIGQFIDELYSKGVTLHTISSARGPGEVMRPEDVPEHAETMKWFSRQADVAREKFLKYMDFRKS